MEMRISRFVVFNIFEDTRSYSIIVSYLHTVLTELIATHVQSRVVVFVVVLTRLAALLPEPDVLISLTKKLYH
jgi:hypothetical protein